jgi:hypothetical protein
MHILTPLLYTNFSRRIDCAYLKLHQIKTYMAKGTRKKKKKKVVSPRSPRSPRIRELKRKEIQSVSSRP